MSNKLKQIRRLIEGEVGYSLDINTRRRDVVFARAVYYRVARDMFNGENRYSLSAIGKELGKDHATVLHALRNVVGQAMNDEYYAQLYSSVLNAVKKIKATSPTVVDNIDVQDLREHNVRLAMENSELKRRLRSAMGHSDRFAVITSKLSEEQLEQVYEKIDVMVKLLNA